MTKLSFFKYSLVALAISGLTPLHASADSKGKVLVVLSSADHLDLKDGRSYDTGYFLNELAVPLKKIIDAGYTPVFANPAGKPSVMDKNSVDKMFFGGDDAKKEEAVQFVANMPGLKAPVKLSRVEKDSAGYVGIFIPGGHAPLQDLITDKSLGKILRSFHKNGRPTGIICHGPVTMLSTLPDSAKFKQSLEAGDKETASRLASKWPYKGYKVTAFSTDEEKQIEGTGKQLGGYVRLYISDALEVAGASVKNVAPWGSNVVVDRELVTGQQPLSAEAFGEAFVAMLKSKSQK